MRLEFIRFCALSLILAVMTIGAGAERAWSGKTGELVMFDSKACTVCRKFEAEIGDDYLASEAAGIFPLRRINIHRGTVDFRLELPVTMTPTFVFVAEGAEIARFVGYPGRKHFFMLVDAAADEYRKSTERGLQATSADSAAAH